MLPPVIFLHKVWVSCELIQKHTQFYTYISFLWWWNLNLAFKLYNLVVWVYRLLYVCVLEDAVEMIQYILAFPYNSNTSAMLRCHIYDNQSIIHLLDLPLPCVDPTAMLPAHIWLHGEPLSPGWDLPQVMGHLGGQMKLRLDECFVYYEYGALWRHWQLHIDSLQSRRPTSALVLFLLFRTQRTNTELWIWAGFSFS